MKYVLQEVGTGLFLGRRGSRKVQKLEDARIFLRACDYKQSDAWTGLDRIEYTYRLRRYVNDAERPWIAVPVRLAYAYQA